MNNNFNDNTNVNDKLNYQPAKYLLYLVGTWPEE